MYHLCDMDTTHESTTPTKSRTRNAILKAALEVFVVDRSASFGDIARKADVARSTVHRYFPGTADLHQALTEYSREQVLQVAEQARLDEGPAIDALTRVALEYFERWDAVMWDYHAIFADNPNPDPTEFDIAISDRIKQGQAEGSIDPTMPYDWIQHAMFAVVYSAWDYARTGNPPAQAAMMVMATMRKVMAPTNRDGSMSG